MLYFIVYLFDVYGPILKTVLGFAIFMFVGVIALLMQTKEAGEDATPETIKEVEDENQKITEKAGKALSKGLFALILYILLPSKQGLAMLGGVYAVSYTHLDVYKRQYVSNITSELAQPMSWIFRKTTKEAYNARVMEEVQSKLLK